MLDGEKGPAVQKFMKLLVGLGDILGAERLIPVSSVHVSGISIFTVGDAGVEFLSHLSETAKFAVAPTTNPAAFSPEKVPGSMPRALVEKQLSIVRAFEKMGATLTLTCTPYYTVNRPSPGKIVAWAESSAAIYANSVLGAYTNRESSLTALASAITGRTLLYGLRIEENRRPTHLIRLGFKVRSYFAASLLGFYVGMKLGESVPYFENLIAHDDLLKSLGAALATSSACTLFYHKGSILKTKALKTSTLEKICIEERDIMREDYPFSIGVHDSPDKVILGCPHLSLRELRKLCASTKGKKARSDVEVVCCTSSQVYKEARREGIVSKLLKSGVKIEVDCCPTFIPPEYAGARTICTDSCKLAYYASKKYEVYLADRASIVKSFFR